MTNLTENTTVAQNNDEVHGSEKKVLFAPYAQAVYDTIVLSDLKPIRFGQRLQYLEFFIADFLLAMDEAGIDNPHNMDSDTVTALMNKHFNLHIMFLLNKLEENPGMDKFFTKVWWNGASDFQRVREVHKHIRLSLLSAIKSGLKRANVLTT